MPEEKKENKAAKKDSFTFSDKIKNSKPAASKSFANRISSKIGSDGKPKKTLFERTKRDAPFFIAAIVALLLLPFLYKYSGSIDEEPTMITPATEDTPFDPNRSGFDGIGDPEGQIAQLSGRDPMSLIIGFGDKKEEVSDELPFRNDLERSGLDEDYSSSNNTSKEYNERNVYKYKKQAAPATKAAFKKTNINPLRGAGLTSRSGGKLSVGMWGGSMKKAADKVKGDAPKSSPKPVSLQPLQAAGKPSRSYFGQGAAAEARRSKDAMSKANAMQALMDAQMKPIEPGKIGGIGGGDFGGPGGGNGNLERKFAFNGKEPWWWDMMKQRSQMEWEAKFNRKWDWIKWGDKLAQNILGGIINCLMTGDDGGGMGSMLGTGEGGGKKAECCGYDETKWKNSPYSNKPFGEDSCKGMKSYIAAQENKEGCGWVAGNPTGKTLGFIGVRVHCLGLATGGGYGSGEPSIREGSAGGSACADLNTTHNYSIKPEGEALKWHTYHYIVARNYLPSFPNTQSSGSDTQPSGSNTQQTIRLCDEYSDNLRMRKQSAAGVAAAYDLSVEDSLRLRKIENMLEDLANDPKKNKVNIKNLETERDSLVAKYAKTSGSGKPNNNSRKYTTNADPESLNDACVVYVAESEILDWERGFKPDMIDLLEQLIQKRGVSGVSYDKSKGAVQNYASSSRKLAEEAFEQLDLYMIAGMSSKYKIGTSSNMKQLLPMPYWKFQEAFLERRGTTTSDRKEGGYRTNVSKRKHRQVGIDTVFGAKCYFDNAIKLSCVQNSSPAKAKVTFTSAFQASRSPKGTDKTSAITLKASYYPGDSERGLKEKQAAPMPQIISVVTPETTDNMSYVYTYSRMLEGASNGKATEPTTEAVGTVKWELFRGGEMVKTVSCDFNNSGDSVNPYMPVPQCKEGEVAYVPKTKKKGECQQMKTCQANGQWTTSLQNVPGDSDCEPNGDGNKDGDQSVTSSTVSFYNELTRIPKSVAILQAESRPGKQGDVSDPQWKTCNLTSGNSQLLELDSETLRFFEAAKAKFDSATANKNALVTLAYNEKALTVANLVDAIMIDPNNGTVPANTVCLLGKTIGAASRDPQAKAFDNLFGMFLAFINYDAASFPSRKTYDKSGIMVLDSRFKSGTEYWWGGYVRSGNRQPYVNQINKGVWTKLPLRELSRKSLPTNGSEGRLQETHDQTSRTTYHELYADLMRPAPCEYRATQTVTRDNVIKYITSLCDTGEGLKPKAAVTAGNPKQKPTVENNRAFHRANHGI